MGTQERICRLCLKVNDSFIAIEGDVKDVLDKFLPNIDLAVVREPIVCTNCAEMLIKCFNFKARCHYVHDHIILPNNKENVELDLKNVCLDKDEDGIYISEDQIVCGFCISPVQHCSAISLHDGRIDIMLQTMIEKCLPELDLSIIKTPVICTSCHGSLEACFHFVTNCLIVEGKIKKYCETFDINSKSQIELSNLLQFKVRDVTTSEVGGNSIDIIKVENQLCEETEIDNGGDIFNPMFCDDSKNVKEEMDMNNLKFKNEEQYLMSKTEENSCGENKETLVTMEDQKCVLHDEIEIKTEETDFVRIENQVVLPQPPVTTRLMPNFDIDLSNPYIEQTFTNENVSAIRIYQCEFCPFQTKCTQSLEVHVLKHRDPSEIAMFKCLSCSFQSKYKSGLIQHSLIHKNPSEITMFKCDFCLYQTKHKCNLKKHHILHESLSKVTMHKCDSCTYQTKYKSALKTHLLIHKDSSETTMYKCESCLFETKDKHYLKTHLLTHKDFSETAMYKCESCSYQTKHKQHLKTHLLIHKDFSETKTYKCESCSYQTKYKHSLKAHLLVHKDLSETTLYKCESCLYQTKHKQSLKTHLRIHKDSSEATMYKCESCLFQTKHKQSLKVHLLVHKNVLETTMYKCESCLHQTIHKRNLKRHLLIHKDSSETTMYKCESCLYQTKHKRQLKTHLLIHKDFSEATM